MSFQSSKVLKVFQSGRFPLCLHRVAASRCLLDGIGWPCLQFPFVGFGGERAGNQLVVLIDEDVLELDLDSGVGQEGNMCVPAAGKHAVAARGLFDFKVEAFGGSDLI